MFFWSAITGGITLPEINLEILFLASDEDKMSRHKHGRSYLQIHQTGVMVHFVKLFLIMVIQ